MARAYLIFIFLLFPLSGCYSQNQSVADFKPSAKAESPLQEKSRDPYVWDFGAVKKGEILKHAFVLKNETRRVLAISGTNTTCGCTVSSVQKNKLLPGESTEIKVEFNTKGYRGQTQQFIFVNTNDTANPVLRFTVKAVVE